MKIAYEVWRGRENPQCIASAPTLEMALRFYRNLTCDACVFLTTYRANRVARRDLYCARYGQGWSKVDWKKEGF